MLGFKSPLTNSGPLDKSKLNPESPNLVAIKLGVNEQLVLTLHPDNFGVVAYSFKRTGQHVKNNDFFQIRSIRYFKDNNPKKGQGPRIAYLKAKVINAPRTKKPKEFQTSDTEIIEIKFPKDPTEEASISLVDFGGLANFSTYETQQLHAKLPKNALEYLNLGCKTSLKDLF